MFRVNHRKVGGSTEIFHVVGQEGAHRCKHTSFTSNFDLFDAVLQLIEAVNMKRVDMSTSSVIGEVAGIFQGRKYIKVDVADCFELRVRHCCCVCRCFWLRGLFDL